MIEAIPASNDVNLPGLATTETLTRHVNLNYFSKAVSREGEERLADADSWRITGYSSLIGLGKSVPTKRPLCATWARMSHPDPNGAPDRRPIKVGEVSGESRYRGTLGDPGASLGQPC